MIREPEPRHDLPQQGGNAQALEPRLELPDDPGIARPQRPRQDRDREHQMAADPHGGAEQVKRHEQTIFHVWRNAPS